MTDDQIIDGIIAREGGYVDHPDDAGGPTKFGITLSTLATSRNFAVDASDVEHLSIDEARAIYRKRYLEDSGIWKIAGEELRARVLDAAVNHGPGNAIKMLQRAIGVTADGAIGAVTLTALPHLDQWKMIDRFTGQRCKFYGDYIQNHPEQKVFAAGWFHRLGDLAK